VAIAVQRNLFAVVLLSGVYSFLMATVLVALDAVDVGMTEASVGAGISTVLLLGALHLCGGEEAKPIHRPWLPLALAVTPRSHPHLLPKIPGTWAMSAFAPTGTARRTIPSPCRAMRIAPMWDNWPRP
jgi:hypothetical protein